MIRNIPLASVDANIHVGADAPDSPDDNEVWLDTGDLVWKVYLQGAWREVDPATAPTFGELAQTLPALTQSMAGDVTDLSVSGTIGQTLPALSQSMAADVTEPASGNTWFTDFSEFTTDAFPTGFTTHWDQGSSTTWAVREKAGTTGGKCLEFTGSTNGRRGLQWDAPGTPEDVEVVARLRASSAIGQRIGAYVRGDGSTTDLTGAYAYLTRTSNGSMRLAKLVNGTETDLHTASGSAGSGAWFWVRLRVSGSTLSFKAWLDGDPEPAAWSFEDTDTDVPDAGWVGLTLVTVSGSQDCDVLGVATGGGTAPTSS